MIIMTEILIIRHFEIADSDDIYDYLSKEDVVKYEPYKALTHEDAISEATRRATDHRYFAVSLKSGKVIGNLYFAQGEFDTWTLGYVFSSDYWGKGYAYESTRALISYAFQKWNARRIVAMCNPLNEASWRLLERLSFRREGTLIKNISFSKDDAGCPIWQDTYEYALLKEEWDD